MMIKKAILILSACLICSFVGIKIATSNSWQLLTTESDERIVTAFGDIVFFDESHGLGVDVAGVAKTTDGGTTWTLILGDSSGNDAFFDLFFTDTRNGILIGSENRNPSDELLSEYKLEDSSPLILQTNDQGENWTKVRIEEKFLTNKDGKFNVFRTGCLDTSGDIWLAGNKGIVHGRIENNALKVIDVKFTESWMGTISCGKDVWSTYGKTMYHFDKNKWVEEPLPDNVVVTEIKHFKDEVWAVGTQGGESMSTIRKGYLLKRDTNNKTWVDKTPPEANSLYDVNILDKTGWVVGDGGAIYFTKDGGDTWEKTTSPTSKTLIKIFFLNENTGWISGESKTILKYKKLGL